MNNTRKKLHMIGNSHIDIVWFWKLNEGLQEIKATFSSALDRMKEYKDFKFTASSVFYLKWIETVLPEMFNEIKEAVKNGRWEIVGGWSIEPDCNLPSGESFVRQGLYSQRYLKEKFGKIVEIGYNIDSFGHNHMLPQILKKSGMNYYIFMRPNDTQPYLFNWNSPDGSQIVTCKLPGEYTTWFKDAAVNNITVTLEKMGELDEMVCFYGVGNHGGGPTKANIEAIYELMEKKSNVSLSFSTLDEFFKNVDTSKLEKYFGEHTRVNTGCYSVDSKLKELNRKAENTAVRAERIAAMAYIIGNQNSYNKNFEEIWEKINLNQFHDTLGGTSIKEARDEAVMELGMAISQSYRIENLCIQNISNQIDTLGVGYPLIIFNPNGYEIDQYIEAEINWFCKAPLKILDNGLREVPYQRVKTSCTMINRNIGGRRNVIFKANIPAYGYRIFRLLEETPSEKECLCNTTDFIQTPDSQYVLENSRVRLGFDNTTGALHSFLDKCTDYDMLNGKVTARVYVDKRDTWGDGDTYYYCGEEFELESIKKVETGLYRSAIRVRYRYNTSYLEQMYYLYSDTDYVLVKNHLAWNESHSVLKLNIPFNIENPVARVEIPYGFIDRKHTKVEDDYMHSWAKIYDAAKGCGGVVANSSKYAYSMENNAYQLVVARSSIYAQGNCEGWYSENDNYRFTDQGEQDFALIIKPFGQDISNYQVIRLSHILNLSYEYLADTNHTGTIKKDINSFIELDNDKIMLEVVKQAEDDGDLILRLYETEGLDSECNLNIVICPTVLKLKFCAFEIKTIKVSSQGFKEVNMLEV